MGRALRKENQGKSDHGLSSGTARECIKKIRSDTGRVSHEVLIIVSWCHNARMSATNPDSKRTSWRKWPISWLPRRLSWMRRQKVLHVKRLSEERKIVFGCACGMWKFTGQRSNLCHSSNLGCCSDNTGSLTHCTRGNPLFVWFCDSCSFLLLDHICHEHKAVSFFPLLFYLL